MAERRYAGLLRAFCGARLPCLTRRHVIPSRGYRPLAGYLNQPCAGEISFNKESLVRSSLDV